MVLLEAMRGVTTAVGLTMLLGGLLPRAAEPGQVGGTAPPLQLEGLLQASDNSPITWEALRGQVVVLEFWATWCAPCVAALPHWNELVGKLEGAPVRFVSITDEPVDKIEAFLRAKPIRGWVGLDTDRSVFEAYGVMGRPHTVIVDGQGVVRAVAEPMQVTEQALRELVAGRSVALPHKLSFDESMASLLPALSPSPLVHVSIRPSTFSSGGMQTMPGVFRGFGLRLESIVRAAYPTGVRRMVLPGDLPGGQYDVLAQSGESLDLMEPMLQDALRSAFGLSGRQEQREADVFLLRTTPETRAKLKPARSEGGGGSSNRGRLSGQDITLDRLAYLLEAQLDAPVLDETGLDGHYEVDLKWDADDPASLPRAVRRDLGLDLQPGRRTIEFIVIERTVTGARTPAEASPEH